MVSGVFFKKAGVNGLRQALTFGKFFYFQPAPVKVSTQQYSRVVGQRAEVKMGRVVSEKAGLLLLYLPKLFIPTWEGAPVLVREGVSYPGQTRFCRGISYNFGSSPILSLVIHIGYSSMRFPNGEYLPVAN